MYSTKGYAAQSESSPLTPFSFERRDPLPNDVQFDILFCGDLPFRSPYRSQRMGRHHLPVRARARDRRPGRHGRKRDVKKFKEGDLVAVGCMVDSDRTCANCKAGLEQFCEGGATFTYNSKDLHTGGMTYGGYSKSIVVNQDFVLRLSDKLDLAASAPLLCAGITTFSPLRKWKVGKGQKVGVVGLGGLGHMALKFANAFGADVTLFTTSPGKEADAKRLGAHEVIITRDQEALENQANRFDFIIDTVSAQHNINAYLGVLKRDGVLCLVGVPPEPIPVAAFNLIMPRRQLAGSLIGGIAETQEMLDFCAERGIVVRHRVDQDRPDQ